ncbi:MAG: hypothetical protein D6769_03890 [Methanobacteriota archaeon]|nr:MAG: hypothetical protein D6769_03890 [Euryarchaeota archaeon]
MTIEESLNIPKFGEVTGVPYQELCPDGECECKNLLYERFYNKYLSWGLLIAGLALLAIGFPALSDLVNGNNTALAFVFLLGAFLVFIGGALVLSNPKKNGYMFFNKAEMYYGGGSSLLKLTNGSKITYIPFSISLGGSGFYGIKGFEMVDVPGKPSYKVEINPCSSSVLFTFYRLRVVGRTQVNYLAETHESLSYKYVPLAQIALKKDGSKLLATFLSKNKDKVLFVKNPTLDLEIEG